MLRPASGNGEQPAARIDVVEARVARRGAAACPRAGARTDGTPLGRPRCASPGQDGIDRGAGPRHSPGVPPSRTARQQERGVPERMPAILDITSWVIDHAGNLSGR